MISIPASLSGGDDPKKPTKQQLAAANQFAKDFAMRKGMTAIGANAHVGDSLPPTVDAAGNVLQPQMGLKLPHNTIMDIRQVPSYVTADSISMGQDNIPYFQDQSTGDFVPIHPDILRSSRFNPHRGQTDKSIAKK